MDNEQCLDLPTREGALQGVDSVPAYLRDNYTWAYLSPLALTVFDRHWMVSLILLGNYTKLESAVLEELRAGMTVLQPACVYGRYSTVLADYLGDDGFLDVIDVAPIQAGHCEIKLLSHANTHVSVADAADPGDKQYDAICCFFLLHEVPEDKKRSIVNNLLSRLEPGGKLIFVDYHRPHWAHPFKALISAIFATLEPFARDLWKQEIRDYSSNVEEFNWKKTTYFGAMYQKVVVTRK